MSKPNDGGSAFPVMLPVEVLNDLSHTAGPAKAKLELEKYFGMSLRAYFAGQVLVGLCANSEWRKRELESGETGMFTNIYANLAVQRADALIAELAKETP